jgi:hypothetical protein
MQYLWLYLQHSNELLMSNVKSIAEAVAIEALTDLCGCHGSRLDGLSIIRLEPRGQDV